MALSPIQDYHRDYQDKDYQSEPIIQSAYHQRRETTDENEERLFKFSPLSSKKHEDEDNQAVSSRSFMNQSTIVDNRNNEPVMAQRSSLVGRKRTSLNNT